MIEARRPDIVVMDRMNSETLIIIDVVVLGNFRVKKKESEKNRESPGSGVSVNPGFEDICKGHSHIG